MTHQFTPANLAAFIHIRAATVRCRHRDAPPACRLCQLRYRTALRKRCRLSVSGNSRIMAGQMKNGELRTRIWKELGCDPAESGVRLTDDGGQEVME